MAYHKGENAQNVALEGVDAIRNQMELLRDQLASFYMTIDKQTYPLVEAEVGDVFHAIRQACKRMRKAQAKLAQEALPGMRDGDAA